MYIRVHTYIPNKKENFNGNCFNNVKLMINGY